MPTKIFRHEMPRSVIYFQKWSKKDEINMAKNRLLYLT